MILLPQPYMTFDEFDFLFNLFAFQIFDFEHIWWRLFQKRMRTNFDIYVYIPYKR